MKYEWPNGRNATSRRIKAAVVEKTGLGWGSTAIAQHIAEMLGRRYTPSAVRFQRKRLGISGAQSGRLWTRAERQLAYDCFEAYGRHFEKISQVLASKGFQRTAHAVEGLCRRSGLIVYGDRERPNRGFRSQDAKFCKAMRAAPEWKARQP